MNTAATYIAIYRKGQELPVALFLDEQDASEWHANPDVYSNCRRKIVISPDYKPKPKETEAERLLRILVMPGDHDLGNAIDAGKKLLNIK